MTYFQDEFWIHFGEGRSRWRERCRVCQLEAETQESLPSAALYCWKVEIWYDCWAHPKMIDSILLAWATEVPELAGKFSLQPLPVIAGDPTQGPYPASSYSRVALLYLGEGQCLRELSNEAEQRLLAGGAGPGGAHHRRGCWAYDDLYSSWTTWAYPSKAK